MKKLKKVLDMEKRRGGPNIYQTGVDVIPLKLSLSQKLKSIWNKSTDNLGYGIESGDFADQSKRVAREANRRHPPSSYSHNCRACRRGSSESIRHDHNNYHSSRNGLSATVDSTAALASHPIDSSKALRQQILDDRALDLISTSNDEAPKRSRLQKHKPLNWTFTNALGGKKKPTSQKDGNIHSKTRYPNLTTTFCSSEESLVNVKHSAAPNLIRSQPQLQYQSSPFLKNETLASQSKRRPLSTIQENVSKKHNAFECVEALNTTMDEYSGSSILSPPRIWCPGSKQSMMLDLLEAIETPLPPSHPASSRSSQSTVKAIDVTSPVLRNSSLERAAPSPPLEFSNLPDPTNHDLVLSASESTTSIPFSIFTSSISSLSPPASPRNSLMIEAPYSLLGSGFVDIEEEYLAHPSPNSPRLRPLSSSINCAFPFKYTTSPMHYPNISSSATSSDFGSSPTMVPESPTSLSNSSTHSMPGSWPEELFDLPYTTGELRQAIREDEDNVEMDLNMESSEEREECFGTSPPNIYPLMFSTFREVRRTGSERSIEKIRDAEHNLLRSRN